MVELNEKRIVLVKENNHIKIVNRNDRQTEEDQIEKRMVSDKEKKQREQKNIVKSVKQN